MAVPLDRPADALLIAFESGLLDDAAAEAVVYWLETVPNADAIYERVVHGRTEDLSDLFTPPSCAAGESAEWTEKMVRRVDAATANGGEPSRVPVHIREYELLGPLGEGGMGRVYRARHRKLRRNCAIKLLGDRLRDHRTYRGRFEREMAVLGQLDHPNLVRAYDAGTEGDYLFLVMELLDGRDLQTHVERYGPMGARAACAAIRQAAAGLHEAHDHRLIHRDVKPANLFLTRAGVVKVIDLGLALATAPDIVPDGLATSVKTVMGTPDYMAPEQWSPGAAVDRRADIYALGATLVYLMTGKAPFADGAARTAWDTWQAHKALPPPTVGYPEIDAVIARCMAKTSAERPATAAEVARSLGAFAADESLTTIAAAHPDSAANRTVVTPADARTPARRMSRRRWWLSGTAAAAGVAAAYWLTRPKPPAPPLVFRPRHTLTGHAGAVMGVAFSPDGRLIASAGKDRAVIVWDATTWELRSKLIGHQNHVFNAQFSPDGRRLVSSSDVGERCAARIWDVSAGKELAAVGEPSRGTFVAAWTADGTELVTGGWDQTVTVWDATTYEAKRTIEESADELVRAVSFSPDGRTIAVGGRGPAKLWNFADGTRIPGELPIDGLPIFLPAGDELVTWSYWTGEVTVWSLAVGRPRLSWKPHAGRIQGASVSPDGRFVATVGDDSDPVGRVWRLTDGRMMAELVGHTGPAYGVTFSPDGRWLASGGVRDYTVRLWDVTALAGAD